MPFVSGSWDGSASRYRDAAHYCSACLIKAPGEPTVAGCKLPVKTPEGSYHKGAMAAAAAVLAGARGGVSASPEAKRSAARKLMRLYGEAKMDPPEGLMRMARG